MGERTLVVTMSLPPGRDWEWFEDLNIVGVSDRLDGPGRERARRAWLATRESHTQPISLLPCVPTGQLAG